jgi:hypothetical protein
MPLSRSWYGESLHGRVHRAAGRAIVTLGTHVAVETKRVTHVQYGTLKRSVHVAPTGYDGAGDEGAASGQDMLSAVDPSVATHTAEGAAIEVGSWLPYACAEWIGRGHPGINEGMEMVRGARASLIVGQAFREEGL